MRNLLIVLLVLSVAISFASGCGRHGESTRSATQADTEQAEYGAGATPQTEAPNTGSAYFGRSVGVAPFHYATSLPDSVETPESEWVCEWKSGDGARHIGKDFTHEYSTPGEYVLSWEVRQTDGEVASTGSSQIEVLQIIDGRYPGDSTPDLLDCTRLLHRRLSEDELVDTAVLPVERGVLLVSPTGALISKILYEPGSFSGSVDSPNDILTFSGGTIDVYGKDCGCLTRQLRIGAYVPFVADIAAIAYSAAKDGFYVLVFPRGEDEVPGHYLFMENGTWKTRRLESESVTRRYTAGYQMLADDSNGRLLIVSRGVWAAPALQVVDYETGETLSSQDIPNSGFTGIRLDESRGCLWLSESNSAYGEGKVTRLALAPRGGATEAVSVIMNSSSIALDPETGECWCVVGKGVSSEPARLVLLDDQANLTLTGEIDGVTGTDLSALKRNGIRVVSQDGEKSVLIASHSLYQVSLQTMRVLSSSTTSVDSWVIGASSNGFPVIMDPKSLSVFTVEDGTSSLSRLLSPPEISAVPDGDLIDCAWHTASATCFGLFSDTLLRWGGEQDVIEEMSLTGLLQNTSRSTYTAMEILAAVREDALVISLPSSHSREKRVFLVDWSGGRMTEISSRPPSGSAVQYCDTADAVAWVEDGCIWIDAGSSQTKIKLPENVMWSEEIGVSFAQDSAIGVVPSAVPAGLVATVDIVSGRLNGIVYVGSLRETRVIQLTRTALWIADDARVYRLAVVGESAGSVNQWHVTSSAWNITGVDFPDCRHVYFSQAGDSCFISSPSTGQALSLEEAIAD